MKWLPAIGLAALTAGTAGAEPDPPEPPPVTLTVALEVDPGKGRVRPAAHALYFTPDELLSQLTGETLVALRDDLSIAPMLAEDYRVSDDGRTYTFRIRRDAKFHNGQPVTATDVVWVWRDYYLNPATSWPCRIVYDGRASIEERTNGAEVVAVEAAGVDTIVFRLARPSNLFLARMADVTTVGSCAPFIFHRDSIDESGAMREPIGTGPYRLAGRDDNGTIRLTRFDGYVPRTEPRDGYAGAREALVDQLLLRPFVNRTAMLDALVGGEVDIVLDVKAGELDALRQEHGLDLQTRSTINFWNLLIQTQDPLLSDRRIRRAIAHAIDTGRIASVMTAGRQLANPSPISRNSHFHTAAHDAGHDYDPGRARRLLQEAGYTGQAIELQTNDDAYPEMLRIAMLLREMLTAAGFNIVLKVMPWEEQLETHFRGGSFQLQSYGQSGRNHPVLVYGKFVGPKARMARFQWDDAEAFALVAAAQEAPGIEPQQRIFDELHARMLLDVPTIVLFNFEYHDAVRAGVCGFESTSFMRPLLWGVGKLTPDATDQAAATHNTSCPGATRKTATAASASDASAKR